MSLVKADDACLQVRFGESIIPTDVRDGSIGTDAYAAGVVSGPK